MKSTTGTRGDGSAATTRYLRGRRGMTVYKVEILCGYGKDPDIEDVLTFDTEAEAEAQLCKIVEPCRVAMVVGGAYYYKRFGQWTPAEDIFPMEHLPKRYI